MNNIKKTALFISYYYPSGIRVESERFLTVGAERILKFRKFLPEFGYDTRVLTTRLWGGLSEDKEEGIYRALDPSLIYDRIQGWIKACLMSSKSKTEAGRPVQTMAKTKPLRTIIGWVKQCVVIPDRGILWFPFAVWKGYKLLRSEKFDVIVVTFQTATNLLVGACLSILTNVPLVLDFRDGWLYEPLESFLRHNRFRQAIDGMLERLVVKKSKVVVTVSDTLTAYFHQKHFLGKDQALTITNGFDPYDWCNINKTARTNNHLRIVHTGSFGASRFTVSLMPFLNGLACVPANIRSQIEILMIGNLIPTEKQAINDLGLNDVIHILPPVTREQSLRLQLSADVLLLIAGTDRSVATSKLFEYLYARRPILAVGHRETAACQIVQKTKAGIVIEPENEEEIASEIVRLVGLWQNGGLSVYGKGDISMYDRRYLSKQLAMVLDQAAKK